MLASEEQLKECDLETLEMQRLGEYQMDVYKVLNGYENIDRSIFSAIHKSCKRTRGHDW